MRIRQNMVGVAVAGTFLLGSSVANALTITSYFSVSSFVAGVQANAFYTGSYEVENFNDGILNPNLTITGPQLSLFATPLPDFTLSDGLVMGGVVDGSDTITIGFGGREMYALGAHWNLANVAVGGPGSNITLNLTSGGTFTFDDFIPNTFGGTFKGFVSDTPFTSVVLSEGTACCKETFQLDNLKYAQAVPEPETYAMFLAGLGLMGFVARRRKQSAKV